MNWDAIGAVGEILGALAVVMTLAYLARQVKYAKAEAADTNRLNRANGVQAMQLAFATNNELLCAVANAHGMHGYYQEFAEELGISPDDAARCDWMHSYYFWLHWGQFSSTLDDEGLAELGNLVSKFYLVPAVRFTWDNSPYGKTIFEQRFVDFVDGIIKNAE
jgi:hypothetical protein